MMLRAEIRVGFGADSLEEAAEHQRRLDGFVASLREVYPDAELTIRGARARPKVPGRPPPRIPNPTGALHRYFD